MYHLQQHLLGHRNDETVQNNITASMVLMITVVETTVAQRLDQVRAHLEFYNQVFDGEGDPTGVFTADRDEVDFEILHLEARPQDEVHDRVFRYQRLGHRLSKRERIVGFWADGKYVSEEGAPVPSSEELEQLLDGAAEEHNLVPVIEDDTVRFMAEPNRAFTR